MTRKTLTTLFAAWALALLSACGGDGADGAAQPPLQGVGPAGGTVASPAGAQVVVPANALAQTIDIQITQSSAGAPALPASLAAAGPVFAFTPHGTVFGAPVTVTIPFDPAQVPAGVTPTLLKTNAQGQWEPVVGASVNGNALTGNATSFSWWVAAVTGSALHVVSSSPTGAQGPLSVSRVTARDIVIQGLPMMQVTVVATTASGLAANLEITFTQATGADPTVVLNWGNAPQTTVYCTPGTLNPCTGVAVQVLSATSGRIALTNASLNVGGDPNGDRAVLSGSIDYTATSTVLNWSRLGGALDVTPASDAQTPSAAIDVLGRPVVAWEEQGAIYVKRWTGSAWQLLGGDLRLTSTNPAGWPSIAVDPVSGDPLVAWHEATVPLAPLANDWDVWVARWNGAAWQTLGTAPLDILGSRGARYPVLAVAPDRTPVAAWHEEGDVVAVKRWTGTAWELFGGQNGPQRNGPPEANSIAAAVGPSGQVLVAWRDASGIRVASGSTSGWSGLGSIVNTEPTSGRFALSVDTSSRPTVAYAGGVAGGVRVRRFDQGAWTDLGGRLLLTGQPVDVGHVCLATPYGTSNPSVVWLQGSPNYAWGASVWDGTAWQTAPVPTSGTVGGLFLRGSFAFGTTTASAAALPVLTWAELNGNNFDVIVQQLGP